MADLTPEDPRDGPTPGPGDGTGAEEGLARRERSHRDSAADSAGVREDGEGAGAPEGSEGQEGQGLEEDRREYPSRSGSHASHDAAGHPVIVRPAGRKGYQTVTVNRDRARDSAKREARRRRRRRRNVALVAAFGAFVLLVAGLSFAVKALLPQPNAQDYPGPGREEVTFTVNEGEGALAIGSRLEEEDIVASREAFIEAVNQSRSENSIQPGEYPLKRQMKAADAASVLQREGVGQVSYVAINRGMRLNEAIDAISSSTGIPADELEASAAEPTDYGLPEDAPSLEGYLAPGEYRFPVDAEADEIFTLLTEPTFAALEELGITDAKKQFRTLTIASILEAEALPKDYATVAGIIENRLHPENPETGGFLQIDATVIYGLGTRQLQFSAEDKRDGGNEYNTYVHRGLPPGPIGAPSRAALEAAAQPRENDNYYWITTNIETGETKFSKDYAQHQEYQEEYRRYCAENEEICGA